MGSWKSELRPFTHIKMFRVFAAVLLVSMVTGRPDGPGGHHHHGAHQGDHGAGHHAGHGAGHHTAHGHHAATHNTVSLGSTHQVGGLVHVSPVNPVSHPVHVVHSTPVHSVQLLHPVHCCPSCWSCGNPPRCRTFHSLCSNKHS